MHHHCVCNTNNNAPGGTLHHIDNFLARRSAIYCAITAGTTALSKKARNSPGAKHQSNILKWVWYCMVDEYYCARRSHKGEPW